MSLNIVNIALPLLGAERVNAIQDSDWARVINTLVRPMYSYLLEEHAWYFPRQIRSLNKLTVSEHPHFKNAFELPNNFSRAAEIYDDKGYRIPQERLIYRIIGSEFYTNLDSITIEYIADNFDIDKAPESFKIALAYKILSQCSASLMNDPSLLQFYAQRAAVEIANAITLDATNSGSLDQFHRETLI